MSKGVSYILTGLAITAGGYFLMLSAGIGGIVYAPIFYIIGPAFIIRGIIWSEGDASNPSGKRNRVIIRLCIALLVAAFIVGTIITKRDNERMIYCMQKYPRTSGEVYDFSPQTKCLRHEID